MTSTQLSLLVEGRTAARSGRGVRLREQSGLNKSDLARLVGVTPACVSRWEDGSRTPSGESAVAYARALRRIAQEVAMNA